MGFGWFPAEIFNNDGTTVQMDKGGVYRFRLQVSGTKTKVLASSAAKSFHAR